MDVRFINAFVGSICNTFETMCSLKVNVGAPALKSGDGPSTDVSSVIGFSGDAAGSVVLHFGFDAACKVASSFAGEKITREHPDFADAIGELANMVAGGAKAKFGGLDVSISLPNVIIGRDHNVSTCKNSPRIMIPCTTDVGMFHVEIGMEIKKSKQNASASLAATGATS